MPTASSPLISDLAELVGDQYVIWRPEDLLVYEYDGSITVLAHKVGGKELNAPNDAIVHPDDGAIWFTDPGYGSLMNYEGNKGTLHIREAVYRIDGDSGALHLVTDDIRKPNGLCFSPDYKTLYVADTGSSHYPGTPKVIKAWDVVNAKSLTNGRVFASMVSIESLSPMSAVLMILLNSPRGMYICRMNASAWFTGLPWHWTILMAC